MSAGPLAVDTVLTESEWTARAAAHRTRLAPFVDAHIARTRRGERHPVWDFLFTYYNLRPAQLLRWHPGLGIALDGDAAVAEYGSARGYLADGRRVTVDPRFVARRRDAAEHIARLLAATAGRPAALGCFGLHEWAMVYRAPDVRHPVPLRLGADGADAVVEAAALRCTHYDAYRFFTPDAAPRNTIELTRESQVEREQPGCLHAGMDLYKWAFKLSPGAPSELVADAFELARDARELDMRASPYDLADHGFAPVRIETSTGRAEYVRAQAALAQRAAPIRERLLAVCARWP
ncbi:3-methyladenine DNA glycosylase [Tsukamurella soli]|uniref:3-methyladenine DNA glycosylase n=1 Tax=Tsukamurella soli TaxID=644556 RepID=A0ABP8KD68_9ACTN